MSLGLALHIYSNYQLIIELILIIIQISICIANVCIQRHVSMLINVRELSFK